MENLWAQLFSTDDFPARWFCGNWTELHGWVHIGADVAIFGAYAAIPVVLTYFAIKRKDVPFLPIFWLFGAFILACGTGHLIEATIFWRPWYRLSGAMKVVTAIVSWITVVALMRVLPKALELPGIVKLNDELLREVEERRRAEAALRLSEARKTAILQTALDCIISMDHEGKVIEMNPAVETTFGFKREELIGQNMASKIIPERFRERHAAGLKRYLTTGETAVLGQRIEIMALRADGTEFPVELSITAIPGFEHPVFTGIIRDITERKHTEVQRQAALDESKMLLKEIHHRVKNNLQVVSSLLRLQAGKLQGTAQTAVFTDCRERIRAMALIHERLYAAGQFAAIEFGGYISEMVRMILGANAETGGRVRLVLELDEIEVNVEAAVPLSLIANELILNALKHAFNKGRAGTLTVKLRAGATTHELVVQDDGPGLPANSTTQPPAGIGFELVENLTRQIRGEFQRQSSPTGTLISIRWPAQPQPVETSIASALAAGI